MPLLLTWDDLLIQNLKPAETRAWLANWSGWFEGEVKPIFMSKFGDWFLDVLLHVNRWLPANSSEPGSVSNLSLSIGVGLDRVLCIHHSP